MKDSNALNEMVLASVDEQLHFIKSSSDLREINDLLTKLMAQQKVQALIKETYIVVVLDAIVDLAIYAEEAKKEEYCLVAAAMLGRLGAVARGRENLVYSRIGELFDDVDIPLSVETLSDGDEKYYAALCFSNVDSIWIENYCLAQAALIDTSENARKAFCFNALQRLGNLSAFWGRGAESFDTLSSIENIEARFKRVRRISAAYLDSARVWQSDVGDEPGQSLAEWVNSVLQGFDKAVDDQVLADIVDDGLAMLLRIIELRFSYALLSNTYEILDKSKSILGRNVWESVIRKSKLIDRVRLCLNEAALVLARQNRTDKSLIDVIVTAHHSRIEARNSIEKHFSSAMEIDPDIKEWWIQGGSVTESKRVVEHNIGNSEDQQIGSLLITVEENRSVMEKMERAVVPILEISEPPLAASVKRASAGYNDIALIARKLVGMRKLTKTDIKGSIQEYNQLQHEMLGGHKLGVRKVRVVRDGIQKVFGGKTKTLVKPWVEPADD